MDREGDSWELGITSYELRIMKDLAQIIIRRSDFGLCPIAGREIEISEPVELVKFYTIESTIFSIEVEHFIRVPTKWIHRRDHGRNECRQKT